MWRFALVISLVAGILTACADRNVTPAGSVVRDSVLEWRGESVAVEIIDNPSSAPATWRLAPAPVVDVNGDEDGHNPFFRVVRAIRLSDGRIAIADGGSTSVRVLDPQANEVESIGGPGEGPGEFRTLSFMGRLPGDTIVVADLELGRVVVFDREGQYVRDVRWGNMADSPPSAIVGVFDDGSFVARGFTQLGYPPPHGLRRHSDEFYTLGKDGILADTIGAFPGSETYYLPTERGFRANPGLFAQTLMFATAGVRFYVGTSDAWEIGVYASDGRPLKLVRRSIPPTPVGRADVDAEKQSRLAGQSANDLRASLERMLAEMPVPESMPMFDRILVDTDANLWVRHYQPVWRTAAVVWSVFDPDGRIVADVTMPHGFEPHQIGRDEVVGLAKDELDAERVQVYALERLQRSGSPE